MHDLGNQFFFETDLESSDAQETSYELMPEFQLEATDALETSPFSESEGEFTSNEFMSAETDELIGLSTEYEFMSWLKKKAKKLPKVAATLMRTPVGQQAIGALGKIAQRTLGASLPGAGQHADFAKFAVDALNTMANEVAKGKKPSVKPAIIQAAQRHYPMILQVKGTLTASPQQRPSVYTRRELSDEYGVLNETDLEGEVRNDEGTFSEESEIALASELLAVQSEEELDQFLGKLVKRATGGLRKFANSSFGKATIGMLKNAARKALPMAGAALGNMVLPGLGGVVGSKLGSAAGNLFELELEGLSPEDRDFEVARAFVRFAGNTSRRASQYRSGDPVRAARTAFLQSARRYAPGLLRTTDYPGANGVLGSSGSWYRKGNQIVIEGAF